MAREAESKCPISNALRGSLQIEHTLAKRGYVSQSTESGRYLLGWTQRAGFSDVQPIDPSTWEPVLTRTLRSNGYGAVSRSRR